MSVPPVTYPKRLIEVDLPIKEISAHARREKSIRHGHISTLHIWWARRPLAACRAVICASLWPDPADENCPAAFREAAAGILCEFAAKVRSMKHLGDLSKVGMKRWQRTDPTTLRGDDMAFAWEIRYALLDFIADFANWDASTVAEYVTTAQRLTQAAHSSLAPGRSDRPTILDPFAGGGAIPLESLRVGADAFASDVNPVAVLLNKTLIEYAPKHRGELIEGVRRAGAWIGREAAKRLNSYYPPDADGAQPIVYLWARTVRCEGSNCGAEVPLLRSLWLVKKGKKSVALKLKPNREKGTIGLTIVSSADAVGRGTSKGGAATCPICGHTTPVESVRKQLHARQGGAADARLIAVIVSSSRGRQYRLPTEADLIATKAAATRLRTLERVPRDVAAIPDGEINHLRGFFNIVLYGITQWGSLFTPRQLLALTTLCDLVRELPNSEIGGAQPELAAAVRTCMALIVDRVAVRCTSNCIWDATTECIMQVFNQGQALPARWEFAEMNPNVDEGSGWKTSVEYAVKVLQHLDSLPRSGVAQLASATRHFLPDDTADLVVTDPPYYAAIPYADLSDFFYSWLRRSLLDVHPELLKAPLVPKDDELVSLAHRAAMYRHKDNPWFEQQMGMACAEARRICTPEGLGVWVFANKETAAWEAMLGALIEAGWIVTASWPIDTESGNRLRAKDSAALASSIHLACRPRENPDGSLRTDAIGDWRDVLTELPKRIHDWLPRLMKEGVVGADAIFACLGPALEVFSRYSRVEDAAGEEIKLKVYLEKVWEVVAREALSQIFSGVDTAGFEPDARLTAMWLWTLFGGASSAPAGEDGDEEEDDDEGSPAKPSKAAGFALEYDAARKIAQGLGAVLEDLSGLVEVKGDTARLLSVGERGRVLFGQAGAAPEAATKGKKGSKGQMALPGLARGADDEEPATQTGASLHNLAQAGAATTVLDRVHQAMILFGQNRGVILKRLLVDDGVGRDERFWRLANALNALYPTGSDERRWVEGVLTRRKALGL